MRAGSAGPCQIEAEVDPPSPDRLVARFLLRRSYRACGAWSPQQEAVLLIGGYTPKLSAMAKIFRAHSVQAVAIAPRAAFRGADAIAEIMDVQGFATEYVLPLVDCAVGVSDLLNWRLGRAANDPATSCLRRDKFEQQEALRRAGLPALGQIRTADAALAAAFAAPHVGPGGRGVVVKPSDASGGDGIWFCATEADVHAAFAAELGRPNVEGGVNSELVVMEAVDGEEWVVNSVSLEGVHKVTDVWQGPPKERCGTAPGPQQFVYTEQFLSAGSPDRRRVLAFCCSALDALGVRSGAAHTELVLAEDGPRLLEVNARPAGGLPRTPAEPNQLQALAMSLYEPACFAQLPSCPDAVVTDGQGSGAAVVFLRAPRDAWLSAAALKGMASLSTFLRFERDLLGARGPHFQPVAVKRTSGLFSSPGAVVLQGPPSDVRADAAAVRAIEATGYLDEPDGLPPSEDDKMDL